MYSRHSAPAILALLLILTVALPALEGDPVIGWLTRPQGLQRELTRLESDSGPAVERLAATLAALRREIEAWQAAVNGLTLPEPVSGVGRSALIEELSALRAALKQQQ